MARPDLNLLVTLDVLLAEGSVARAARRLRLSPSAMSRALARLRTATGDPLLVRAGRGLVPTPRAIALRDAVGPVVQAGEAVLRPAEKLDLGKLARSFTLRTSEGFVENFGAELVNRITDEAPRARLRFLLKQDQDSVPLRDGIIDLETGVVGKATGPELRTQALFRDRFVGVVRKGHPLCRGRITASRYAACNHVLDARHDQGESPIDKALKARGHDRQIVAIVSGFSTALALARRSDLVATVPERHTGNLRDGLHSFALPFPAQQFTISLLWHPRQEADAAHRWLRNCVRDVCARVPAL